MIYGYASLLFSGSVTELNRIRICNSKVNKKKGLEDGLFMTSVPFVAIVLTYQCTSVFVPLFNICCKF